MAAEAQYLADAWVDRPNKKLVDTLCLFQPSHLLCSRSSSLREMWPLPWLPDLPLTFPMPAAYEYVTGKCGCRASAAYCDV